LTRPSIVPSYLECALLESIHTLSIQTAPIRIYLKPQIDAFITETGTIHYGLPVDLDLSPSLNVLLHAINNAIRFMGFKEFHAHPNPHVTVGSSEDELSNLSSSQQVTGEPGSQYFAGVYEVNEDFVEDVVLCNILQLKVGTTIHQFRLGN
jgi:hypothetical protein